QALGKCGCVPTTQQSRTAIGDGTVESVRVLGGLAGLHSAGCKRAGDFWLAGASRQVLPFLAPSICGITYPVCRPARRWFFFPRCAAGRGECQPAFPPTAECFRPDDHYYFCVVHGV